MGKIKPWRVNVYVTYLSQNSVLQYRERILPILRHFGWLYKLEYGIELCEVSKVSLEQPQEDLFYFRSTNQTPILGKAFQSVIKTVFDPALNPFVEGVCVVPDSMKNTALTSFPDEYWKMLNYPFVRHYQPGESTLMAEQSVIDLIQRDDLE